MALNSLFPKVFTLAAFLSFAFATNAASIKGDVNNDGEVNIADANAVIDVILGGSCSYSSGDINADGEVNIADVNAIIDIILGGSSSQENHEYVDLGLPSGTLWATMNVGANSPEEYGAFFSWGETSPKDYFAWSNYKWCIDNIDNLTKYCAQNYFGNNGFTDDKTELEPDDDAATANWGAGARMPSLEQINELEDCCSWQWTTRNGISGQLGIGPNGNTIFFPAEGFQWNEWLIYEGKYGFIWSRTLYPESSWNAHLLQFDSDHLTRNCFNHRAAGFPVRAVRVSQN